MQNSQQITPQNLHIPNKKKINDTTHIQQQLQIFNYQPLRFNT